MKKFEDILGFTVAVLMGAVLPGYVVVLGIISLFIGNLAGLPIIGIGIVMCWFLGGFGVISRFLKMVGGEVGAKNFSL